MPKPSQNKQILIFAQKTGKEPFTEWLESLRDGTIRKRILIRLRRLEQGNYGDCKALKDGISELRFSFGSGYRLYFGEDEKAIIVLLCGGDKSSQSKDIAIAKKYWQEYQNYE